MYRGDTERANTLKSRSKLITIKADVVDAGFAGLDTIYYFLKAWSLISNP